MSGRTPDLGGRTGNVLRMDQEAHLQGLREVTAEIERLRERLEDMVLDAAQAEVPRKLIAEAIGKKEPTVYNMRRAALRRREAGGSG